MKKTNWNRRIKILLFLFLIQIYNTILLGQSIESAIWFTGGLKFDFNYNPVLITNSLSPFDGGMITKEISDRNGDLMFYYSEQNILNKFGEIIENSDSISYSESNHFFIPHSNLPGIYGFIGPTYAVIDKIANQGKGKVLKKKVVWMKNEKNEVLQIAIQRPNCKGFWLVTCDTMSINFYEFNKHGIASEPVCNPTSKKPDDKSFRINHQFNYFVFTVGGYSSEIDYLIYGSFDNNTGKIPFQPYMLLNYPLYDFCFSPDDSKLYCYQKVEDGISNFIQIKIVNNKPDIANATILYSTPNTLNSVFPSECGLDGKIYITHTIVDRGISIIHNPNAAGLACNFEYSAYNKPVSFSRLSYFKPNLTNSCHLDFSSTSVCLGEANIFNVNTYEFIDSVRWDFGDGLESTEADPSHRYTQAGNYNAKLTATYNNGEQIMINKTIIVQDKPQRKIIKSE